MSSAINDLVLQAIDDIVGLENIEEYTDYYKLLNPLNGDSNIKSAIIFKEDYVMKMFNGTITLQDKTTTTLTLTQWLRQTNTLHYYISHLCIKYNISKNEFTDYKEDLQNFLFFSKLSIIKKYRFDWIRKTLYSCYILDKDVLGVITTNTNTTKQFDKNKIVKKLESSILLLQPNELETKEIEKYRALRKLPIHKNIENIIVEINGIYRKMGISFNYNNGFKKIRIINEKKFRYFSNGSYNELFEARVNNTKTCYVVEGEINSLSILPFIDEDVFSLHNVNSIPKDLFQLLPYKQIIIKIDKDKYYEVKKLFTEKITNIFPEKEIIIDYATDCTSSDFNSLYTDNILAKEVITKINAKL